MISISYELLKKIIDDAVQRYPNECCGIIYGNVSGDGEKKSETIEEVFNSFDDREKYHRFEITSETMLKAELYARKKGCEIIGFYHSHPNCPAEPSEYDRSHALPVYSYIIASVVKGRATGVKSWELSLSNMQFCQEQIKVSSSQSSEKGV